MAFGAPENDQAKPTGVTRRTLVKSAAWSVPVIAFAAPVPAYAASPCTPSTNFDGLTPGNQVQTSIVFYNSLNQPTGVTASIAYASNGQGGDSTPGGTGTVAATSTNPSWNYIEIEMLSELNAGDWVTLTLTLSQAVSGLSFTIHDIDKVRNGQNQVAWEDFVEISGTFSGNPVSYLPVLGNNVTGAGTAASPFQPINWGDNPIDSGLNRVTVGFNAPVNQFVIKYRAGQNGYSGNQHIGLGNISYSICAPAAAPNKQARSLAAPLATEPRLLPQESDGFVGADGVADGTVDS